MKKRILVCLLVFICITNCFAAVYHSIPVDHEVYRIIDTASIRGLIPVQTSVKPYSFSKVLLLLDQMKTSGKLSDMELQQVEQVCSELERVYGNTESKDKNAIRKNLFYRALFSQNGSSFTIGLKLKTEQKAAFEFTQKTKMWDSRNTETAFVMGDLAGAVTYDVNIGISFDRLAPGAYLLTDFNFDAEGWYQNISSYNQDLTKKDSGKFVMGFLYTPEISTSLFCDSLSLRLGAIKHDWGVGLGNFLLSPSAGTMDAFEFTLSPVNWMSFSALDASLGKFSVNNSGNAYIIGADGTGVRYPSDVAHEDYFNNNIAMHKFEIGPFAGVKLDVWESVVYRKRFELQYLNPFAIYMFAQNSCSDFDNEIAGADISVNLANSFQAYAGVAMDEIGSVKEILKNPRNLISYQVGMKWALPELPFSRLVTQVTYLPAFYGSHYGQTYAVNPAGFLGWTTAYVNKGHMIGYPVNPDTLEFLLAFDGTIANYWNLNVTFKDQVRSVQYATHTSGTDILDTMYYELNQNTGKTYADRDFFGNLGINDADLKITLSKKLKETPVTLSASIEGLVHSYRSFTPVNETEPRATVVEGSPVYADYNIGYSNKTTFGSWTNTYTVMASFGLKVNY